MEHEVKGGGVIWNSGVDFSIGVINAGFSTATSTLQCDVFLTALKSAFLISNQQGPIMFLCKTKVSKMFALVPKTWEKVSPDKSLGNVTFALFGG